jgi:hypothetical protein
MPPTPAVESTGPPNACPTKGLPESEALFAAVRRLRDFLHQGTRRTTRSPMLASSAPMTRRPPTSVGRSASASERRRAQAISASYGAILATAVIAALSEDAGAGPLEMLAATLNTSLVFWLAHVFARYVGDRAGDWDSAEWHSVPQLLGQEIPMVAAALLPAAVLGLAQLDLLSRHDAVTVALALAVLELSVWGAIAGHHERWGLGSVALGSATATTLGLLMVFLKVLVH